jgi:hypothetical protein
MEIVTFLVIAAGQFCLLSCGLVCVFEHFPAAVLNPFTIAQRLSNGPWAFLAAFLCPFISAQQLSNSLWAFPSSCWLKRGYFHPFSMKGRISVNIY